MSDQYNSVSDYLRSLSEMADGNYASFYRNLNGQIMFPEPGSVSAPCPADDSGREIAAAVPSGRQ